MSQLVVSRYTGNVHDRYPIDSQLNWTRSGHYSTVDAITSSSFATQLRHTAQHNTLSGICVSVTRTAASATHTHTRTYIWICIHMNSHISPFALNLYSRLTIILPYVLYNVNVVLSFCVGCVIPLTWEISYEAPIRSYILDSIVNIQFIFKEENIETCIIWEKGNALIVGSFHSRKLNSSSTDQMIQLFQWTILIYH